MNIETRSPVDKCINGPGRSQNTTEAYGAHDDKKDHNCNMDCLLGGYFDGFPCKPAINGCNDITCYDSQADSPGVAIPVKTLPMTANITMIMGAICVRLVLILTDKGTWGTS